MVKNSHKNFAGLICWLQPPREPFKEGTDERKDAQSTGHGLLGSEGCGILRYFTFNIIQPWTNRGFTFNWQTWDGRTWKNQQMLGWILLLLRQQKRAAMTIALNLPFDQSESIRSQNLPKSVPVISTAFFQAPQLQPKPRSARRGHRWVWKERGSHISHNAHHLLDALWRPWRWHFEVGKTGHCG